VNADSYGGSFRGDENVLKLIIVVVAESCEYMKSTELHTFIFLFEFLRQGLTM
jgi:hypothetical protein